MSGRQFVPTLKNKTLKLTQSQERKNERLLFHVRNGNVLKVQSLLWRGADPNYYNRNNEPTATPLWWASFFGLPEIVRLLLDSGADVNYRPLGERLTTPLMAACETWDDLHALDVVRLLLDRGADITAHTTMLPGWNAFVFACDAGNRDIVHLLLERGGMGYDGGRVGLLQASANGHTEIVPMLVRAGVDVNFVDPLTQMTPLMQACAFGHLRTVQALVRAGADVNMVSSHGMTAIEYSRRRGWPQTVEYLEGLRRGEFPVEREGNNPIRIEGGPAEMGSFGANDPSRVEGSLGGTGPVPVEDELDESDPSRVATPRTRKGGYYRRKTYTRRRC